MKHQDIIDLLDAHRAARVAADQLADVLRPHLLKRGDFVRDSDGDGPHVVEKVTLDHNGYGVELGPSYCGGGFVLKGESLVKVD